MKNLFYLLGTFEDPDITHVEGEVDPVRDLDIINEELRLKDEEYFNKVYEELERKCVRGGEKKLKPEYVRWLLYFLWYDESMIDTFLGPQNWHIIIIAYFWG